MGKKHDFLDSITDGTTMLGTVVLGQPIVEIAGDQRVLIENHNGVCQYSNAKIGIKVKYGWIHVCGCGLRLTSMTKEQLVISGKINSVVLLRRD